ncbi:MAG: hypothetical protein LBB76_11300 [Azoarcus sp.]|jgi:hypothetical protein|nr:hypothetical protein [Azoarcus sp.]
MKKFVVSIIVVVIILAGGVYFGKIKYDSVLEAATRGLALGKAYGRTVSQSNCILGLKPRYASCSTMECELSANAYIAGCMETATRDDFCNDVPHIQNTDQALDWSSKTCSEYGLGHDRCLKYIHKYVRVCTEQTEKRALSTGDVFTSGFEKGLNQE